MPLTVKEELTNSTWVFATLPNPFVFNNYPPGIYKFINELGGNAGVTVGGNNYVLPNLSIWRFRVGENLASFDFMSGAPLIGQRLY